ncbi:MAG: DinB family protein [Pyrinomonadaceae bacterium]
MNYETIADIYSANAKVREALNATLEGITPDEAATLPDDGKWSIQHVVEHIAMVETGVSMICSRMIEAAKADDKTSDGKFVLSPEFLESISRLVSGTAKVEAPERVQPTGEVAIQDSLRTLTAATATLDSFRGDLESIDVTGHKFPHPFFGPLTATEWLVISGLHERRHTAQIESLLTKIRK